MGWAFSVSQWLFYVGHLLICVGRSSRPSGGYFALSAYQYAPGVSIRSFGTLVAHQYAHSIRSFSVSIRSQRINTLIQRTGDAGVMVWLPMQLRRWRRSCAHSVSRRPQRSVYRRSQRLQTSTAYPNAHSVSMRPQRMTHTSSTAYPHAHSVSIRPQRMAHIAPTAYQYAHSAMATPASRQRYKVSRV